MSERDDGGAAFPRTGSFFRDVQDDGFDATRQDGMTLRDWLAGQALVGLCASGAARDLGETWNGRAGWDGRSDPSKYLRSVRSPLIAADCYMIADALLKERAK